jgi:hypothetical protein
LWTGDYVSPPCLHVATVGCDERGCRGLLRRRHKRAAHALRISAGVAFAVFRGAPKPCVRACVRRMRARTHAQNPTRMLSCGDARLDAAPPTAGACNFLAVHIPWVVALTSGIWTPPESLRQRWLGRFNAAETEFPCTAWLPRGGAAPRDWHAVAVQATSCWCACSLSWYARPHAPPSLNARAAAAVAAVPARAAAQPLRRPAGAADE